MKRDPGPEAGVGQPVARAPHEKTSVLIRRVLAGLPGSEVRIGCVVLQLRRRSFGGLLIVLASLALLPGISFFAGLAIIVPGFQMAAGLRAPLLPRFIRQRKVSVADLRRFGEKVARVVAWTEGYVRPRWLALTSPPMAVVLGALIAALALVVMLPLPFSNLPPAVALLCLSLGILERDGLMVGVGILIAAVALAIGILVGHVAIQSLLPFL